MPRRVDGVVMITRESTRLVSGSTQAVYDLDRRHSGLLKAHGAQRQGVQWSDREIDERANAIERGEYLSDEENEHVALPSPDKKLSLIHI